MSNTSYLKLLIVDDDEIIAESLNYVLSSHYDIQVANDRASTEALLKSGYLPDVALVDLGLPPDTHKPEEGFKIVKSLNKLKKRPRILVLSGQDNDRLVDQAIALGAQEFLAKPCDIAEIKMRLQSDSADTLSDGIVGNSEVIELMRMQIRQFADSPYPVLVEGESGSGKELVAKNLHELSLRQSSPYLTLNCAAFNSQLLESQLFGHVKGSFTGASETTSGFIAEAKEGTLFLDEIADLDLELQSKLLRMLENQEYYRVGETKPRQVQARIVAATNKKLYEQVEKGLFREDLFHRLSVLTIKVPKVEVRSEDKLLLMSYFQSTLGEKQTQFHLDEDALAAWMNYSFPGNVRELRNIVIRLMAKFPGQTLKAEKLNEEFSGFQIGVNKTNENQTSETELLDSNFQLDEKLKQIERDYVNLAIKMSKGNMSKAAQLLGINRSTLYGRLDKKA